METLYQAPLEPTIQDLKVAIQETTLIFPPPLETTDDHHQNKSIFLSNIDQVLNFHVQTLHFFQANPDYPPEVAVARLRNALQKVMVAPYYDFLAGRLKLNHQTERMEIECNGSGVGFVVAITEYSLDQIGDLAVYPNPGFMQLIVPGMEKFDDQPLGVFQVTSFTCGGFALGVSTNHILFDGMSFKTFMENLASQAFDDKPLSIIPCNDRRLLAARSPPHVTFPHPELLKLKPPVGEEEGEEAPSVFGCKQDDLDFKIFSLTPNDINHLKGKARAGGRTKPTTKITGFNVVAAHVWRCKALSYGDDDDHNNNRRDRESMVLYAVDIRPRLRPPLPASYCGNAVLSAYASAKCSELEDEPFSAVVDMVSEGGSRMTDEYARSAIDWGEVHKGFPNGEFLISSWWRIGFDEVVYPWGKPTYSCPLVYHRKDIILLLPEIGGASCGSGVNVLVALPSKEMEKFQTLFHKYLT